MAIFSEYYSNLKRITIFRATSRHCRVEYNIGLILFTHCEAIRLNIKSWLQFLVNNLAVNNLLVIIDNLKLFSRLITSSR